MPQHQNIQDFTIYGSSRIGVKNEGDTSTTLSMTDLSYRTLGTKQYELTNHLGNIQVTVSDRKLYDTAGFYRAEVISVQDYYPFGSLLEDRVYQNTRYAWGFQNQLKINEIYGNGNYMDYKYRGYLPQLGIFISPDPLFSQFPWNSPFAFSENSPIAFIDLEGLERYYAADGRMLGSVGTSPYIRIVDNTNVSKAKKYIQEANNGNVNSADILFYTMSGQFSTGSEEAIINITTTVLKREIGTKYSKIGGIKSHPTGEDSHAFATGKEIILTEDNSQTNVVSETLNDENNLISVLYHENLHNQDMTIGDVWKHKISNNYNHFEVYMKQFNNASFNKTSTDFQHEMRRNSLKLLVDMKTDLNNVKEKHGVNSSYYKDLSKRLNKNIKAYEKKFNTQLDTETFKGEYIDHTLPTHKGDVNTKK